ncbi:hypothetical protein [Sphingopyxis sp.]|uniref:hypothetical protein n=1 Tax=Sphingopyxis sp. TaxID=1908224 RepID=UPI002DFF1832|nr:hypothetical protein [Sphingopyxis sp.]
MADIRAFRFIASILIGFTLVLSSTATAGEQPRPVVVGYLAAFKGLDLSIERTDLSAFTHYNLAFANPDADGHFIRDGRTTCMATKPARTCRSTRCAGLLRGCRRAAPRC